MEAVKANEITIERDYLSQSDGSCKLTQGEFSVLASVNGPIEVKQHLEQIDRATLEVIVTPLVGVTTTRQKYLENLIKTLFSSLILTKLTPRSLIQINLQQMSDFGGLDAEHVFINATNLALMNAGISLDKAVGAVSCVWDGEGNLTVNGEIGDYTNCKSRHTFAFSKESSEPLTIYSWGEFTLKELEKSKEKCYENFLEFIEQIRN